MTGPSHREPLDEHERELARVLRALPAGEPPAALDQRILRAAADAAAAPRRTHRRWLAFGGSGWGIGGAAAAVLALGVSWHLIDPTRNAPFERSSAPAMSAQSGDEAVTVTLAEPEAGNRARADSASEAVAAPPATPLPGRVASQPRERAPVARARSAAPAPAAAPVVAPPVAPAPPPSPEPFADTAASAMDVPIAGSAAAAPVEPPEAVAAQALGEAGRAESAREADALSAERQAKASADTAKARGAMTPAVWLAQVRGLRDAQRRAEAADSLRRFRQYYPQYAIPADLLPLLRE